MEECPEYPLTCTSAKEFPFTMERKRHRNKNSWEGQEIPSQHRLLAAGFKSFTCIVRSYDNNTDVNIHIVRNVKYFLLTYVHAAQTRKCEQKLSDRGELEGKKEGDREKDGVN